MRKQRSGVAVRAEAQMDDVEVLPLMEQRLVRFDALLATHWIDAANGSNPLEERLSGESFVGMRRLGWHAPLVAPKDVDASPVDPVDRRGQTLVAASGRV